MMFAFNEIYTSVAMQNVRIHFVIVSMNIIIKAPERHFKG